MKINIIKSIFVIVIGALVGYFCKIIATDVNQWCSFAVGALTTIGGLIAAFADYPNVNNSRSTNTKVVAWIMAIIIIVLNLVFAFIPYNHEVYIVILALILVVDWFVVYLLARKK